MLGAVSDSSTLIHLAVLGRLELMQMWYEQVLIPPAVWKKKLPRPTTGSNSPTNPALALQQTSVGSCRKPMNCLRSSHVSAKQPKLEHDCGMRIAD